MTAELDRYCPACDGDRSFYRVASTEVHIGTKVKWRCPECDYTFVRIDGDIDTGTASA
jgi:rubredoxin